MKALMYHYVRPERADLPYFRYLHVEDFAAQLDWIEANFGFVSRPDFERTLTTGRPAEGAVLTFDDGFADHFDHVLPELARRGLWGVFYVPTGVYDRAELLDVHRIHLLIGRHGGVAVLDHLVGLIDDDMLVDKGNAAFRTKTYRYQDNDEATNEVKRILNYYISYDHRAEVLARLFGDLIGSEAEEFRRFYMSTDQLLEMAEAGMVIGSHSVSHPVFSRLDVETQWREIDRSFAFLEQALGREIDTFCYPYGGFHNFTDDTERLLQKRGCRYAFNVEPRDVAPADLKSRPMALPRYDCNMFAHGGATMGSDRPPA
ncbi:MAG: polysaccharide deacetylase family protein [Hyphomicrobiales bacterium]